MRSCNREKAAIRIGKWLIAGTILFAGTTTLQAQVSGEQSGRWTLSTSPIVITGNVVVPSGELLRIDPGVIVQFAGPYAIQVNGAISAAGLPRNRIVFTSVHDIDFNFTGRASTRSPAADDWIGLTFGDGIDAESSRLENVVLRFCSAPLTVGNTFPAALENILILDSEAKSVVIQGQTQSIENGLDQSFQPAVTNGTGPESLASLKYASVDPAAVGSTDNDRTNDRKPKERLLVDVIDDEDITFGELTVVTVSKRTQKITDAPGTVYVISEAMIKDRGYRNLEDLLEDVPGVEIQRKSTSEFSNYISFRGIAGNEKFIILQDGFRINSTTSTPHVVGTNYALANARQVEVVIGPASALYGVDAFSGVINIITKQGDELDGGEFSGSFGNYNTTDNAFTFGKQIEDLRFVVTGQMHYSDEPDFSRIYSEEFAWYNDQYSQNGKMRLSPFAPEILVDAPIEPFAAPTKSYFVSGKLNYDDFELGYTQHYESHSSSIGQKPEFNLYVENAQYAIQIESAYATHNYLSADGSWSLQSSLSRGTYGVRPTSRFLNTFSGYRDAFKFASSKSVKLEEQLNLFLGETSSIIAGFSYEDISALPKTGDLPYQIDATEALDLQRIPYIGTDISNAGGESLTILQNFFNLEYKNFGSYAQLQSRLSDAVELTVGGRYDHNTRYGSSVNPRAALVLSPGPQTRLKVLFGQAFLAPSPYKAYQHYGSFISTTDSTGGVTGLFGPFWHLPNPELKPERLRTLEGAVSHEVSENVLISVDGYYTEIRDLIVNGGEPNQVFEGVPVGFAEIPVNRGTAKLQGGTVRVDAKSGGEAGRANFYAAYSFSDGDLDGEVLPFSARHTFKGGVDVKFGRFSVSPRIIYRSSSYHPILNNAMGDRLKNDAFALINVFARYTLTPVANPFQASAFLRVHNLANSKYYNVSFAQDEGFAATPQDPARVSGGVSLTF